MKTIFVLMVAILIAACENPTGPAIDVQRKIPIGANFDRKYTGNYHQNESIDDIKERTEILADNDAQWVTFFWNVYQIEYQSNEFVRSFLSIDSFTEDELTELINHARSFGLQVQLSFEVLPMIEQAGGWCDGYVDGPKIDIDPSNPDLWFENLTTEVAICSEFAQSNGIELLNIGQELTKLTWPEYNGHWSNLVTEVRNSYSESLVYYIAGTTNDEFSHITNEFHQLWDYTGVTWYAVNFSDSAIPTVSEIEAKLESTLISFLEMVHGVTGKQIIIGETSCPSILYPLQYDHVFRGWDTIFLRTQTMNEEGQANYLVSLQSMNQTYIKIIFWHNIYNSRHYQSDGVKEDYGSTLFKNGFDPKVALQRIK
jgi:hypothetical protein